MQTTHKAIFTWL